MILGHMKQHDGFKPRSGMFACGICERNTRRTSKGNCDLCPQCDEWTMDENAINDGVYDNDLEGLKVVEARIHELKEEAASRGGNPLRLGL